MKTLTFTKLSFAFCALVLLQMLAPGTLSGQHACDDGDPCTIDVIDICGNCFHIKKDCDELACDDGDPCTIDVVDINGNCLHFPKTCDDGDPTTMDFCDENGECQSELIVCDDGDPTTIDYLGPDGRCYAVREVCCDDGDPCTEDRFDPATGQCVNLPRDCDDGNPCTIDSCDPETGECINTPLDCDDGDPCTQDFCRDGQCINKTIPDCNPCQDVDCDDGNPCTIDSCDPETGECINTPLDCDDGDPCTQDFCRDGQCINKTIPDCNPCQDVDCDDGNPCTIDSCDPETGECINTPLDCDDGDPCTQDFCRDGQCINKTIPDCNPCQDVDCDDGNPCTIDSCDPETGECINTPLDCDDGDPCTQDFCKEGQCVNKPIPDCNPCQDADCDDGDPCTIDSCDPETGECINIPKDCDDGDPCTIDYCENGWCKHKPDPDCDPCENVDCDDGNPCTMDYCNPYTGACINIPRNCDDGDPCTIDYCDMQTGQCIHEPNPDCGEFCSFTQGFWGNAGGSFNGQTTTQILQDIFSDGPVIVGIEGERSLSIDNTQCVYTLLPGGGPPAALPGNTGDVEADAPDCDVSPISTKNNGTLRNVLLAQTITLALNVRYDSGLGELPLANTCIHLPTALANHLPHGATVNGLLAFANETLAGLNAAPPSLVSGAVSHINEYFDECNEACGGYVPGVGPGHGQPQHENSREEGFRLFPNPTEEEVSVGLQRYAGQSGRIMIFSSLGKAVYEVAYDRLPDEVIRVGLNELSPGIYFMMVSIAGQKDMAKEFVISR